jgi:cytidyltransferase-like protein
MKKHVVVTGSFDDLRSRQVRLLEEAAKLGELTVRLWPDRAIQELTGKPPAFPEAERLYFLNALRYVSRAVTATGDVNPDALPEAGGPPSRRRGNEAAPANELPEAGGAPSQVWVDEACPRNEARRAFCRQRGLEYCVLDAAQLQGFPVSAPLPAVPGRKKVVVTGTYDWFHSGHVRFFEEVSAYGDLYVVVGHDANIRLLKGEGHPLVPEAERRYLVGSIKYVKQALISSGDGWLDADPEIQRLQPDIYAVNEDGDRGGKREYCEKMGIQYLVLKRTPAPGLPRRSSTDLRGF